MNRDPVFRPDPSLHDLIDRARIQPFAPARNSSALLRLIGILSVTVLVGGLFFGAWHFQQGLSQQQPGVQADSTFATDEEVSETVNSTTLPASTTTQTVIGEDASSCGSLRVEDLGLNVYGGAQLNPPQPPDACEIYVAHGDIAGTGTCQVQVFERTTASGLSQATWRLILIRGGTREQRLAQVDRVQRGAAESAGMPCPLS